jgi:hypothetical protein
MAFAGARNVNIAVKFLAGIESSSDVAAAEAFEQSVN